MAFTTAGLVNGGRTPHYQVSYDPALPNGMSLANGLLAKCEQDFALLAGWFAGVDFEYDFPLPVQIANASGGASWPTPSGFEVALGDSPTVTINPLILGTTTVGIIRYLLVSEVTEMFMASQDKGWFEDVTFFSGADEGSKGEGLSRFLGVQFQLANGLGSVPPTGFGVASLWLNSPRADFVNNNPDDNNPDPTNGCTTLFLYYLHNQLGRSLNDIIAAGAGTLSGVYKNLTGAPDGWTPFINLVNSHYPPGFPCNPAGDNIFPVSELTQFYAPNQITAGYSDSSPLFIDRPAMAQLSIQLVSDDPSTVSVPSTVLIPTNGTSTTVPFTAARVPLPFAKRVVNVHAIYGGKTLTVQVEVVPPRITGLTLTPSTVTCGDNAIATVTLDRPSLLGDVVADVASGTGFAIVTPPWIIPQGSATANFIVKTPDFLIAFPTKHATIYVTYGDSSAGAMLTVKSKVIAGILNSLTVFPTEISVGETSTGTVTLVESVPVDTIVGLAALEPGPHPPGIPLPGSASSVASVPPSVKLIKGETSRTFPITATGSVAPHTKRKVTIMAGAVTYKSATLTVDG